MFMVVELIPTGSENQGLFTSMFSGNAEKNKHNLVVLADILFSNIEEAKDWIKSDIEDKLDDIAIEMIDKKIKYSALYGNVNDIELDDILVARNIMILEVPIFEVYKRTGESMRDYIEKQKNN